MSLALRNMLESARVACSCAELQVIGIFAGSGLFAILSFIFKPALLTIVPLWISIPCVLVALRLTARGGQCNYRADMTSKICIVTGANTGIGLQTTKILAAQGATVILACRSEERGLAAVKRLRTELSLPASDNRLRFLPLNLASFASIKTFAAAVRSTYDHVDVLLNNAGIMFCPFGVTTEGFERQFGVNHIGHALLIKELLPLVCKSSGRIINVSSTAHLGARKVSYHKVSTDENYDTFKAYSISKLANILYSNHLQKVLTERGDNVTVMSLHPGVVHTELMRHMPGLVQTVVSALHLFFMKTSYEGAQTSVYCATSPNVVGGAFYADSRKVKPAGWARSKTAAKKLWDMTEEMIKDQSPARFIEK